MKIVISICVESNRIESNIVLKEIRNDINNSNYKFKVLVMDLTSYKSKTHYEAQSYQVYLSKDNVECPKVKLVIFFSDLLFIS